MFFHSEILMSRMIFFSNFNKNHRLLSERCNDTDGGVRGARSVWFEEPSMAHPRNLCPERWRPLRGLGLVSEYLEGTTSFTTVHFCWHIIILTAKRFYHTQMPNTLGSLSIIFFHVVTISLCFSPPIWAKILWQLAEVHQPVCFDLWSFWD